MRTERKILLLSVALVLALTLRARGEDATSDLPPIPPPVQAPTPKGEVIAEPLDLTADRNTTPGVKGILDDLQPSGPLSIKSRTCYRLLGEMKSNVERISADLDDNGKEIDRLIRTSDALAQNITDVAALWGEVDGFQDICATAKRHALLLNEELGRKPVRKWTHVRWSFTATLQHVSKMRTVARELAELEPKPRREVGKDGKVYYVEDAPPPEDPEVARRNASKREVEERRARMQKVEEKKKNESMPLDLDGNRAPSR